MAVEVVSPGSRSRKRDYEDKRAEYLALGLLEYWIVDPEEMRVTVLIRREIGGAPGWEEHFYRDAEVIVGEQIAAFEGTVAELWLNTDEG